MKTGAPDSWTLLRALTCRRTRAGSPCFTVGASGLSLRCRPSANAAGAPATTSRMDRARADERAISTSSRPGWPRPRRAAAASATQHGRPLAARLPLFRERLPVFGIGQRRRRGGGLSGRRGAAELAGGDPVQLLERLVERSQRGIAHLVGDLGHAEMLPGGIGQEGGRLTDAVVVQEGVEVPETELRVDEMADLVL